MRIQMIMLACSITLGGMAHAAEGKTTSPSKSKGPIATTPIDTSKTTTTSDTKTPASAATPTAAATPALSSAPISKSPVASASAKTSQQEQAPAFLPDAEVDAFLNDVFEKSRKLTDISATLTESKSGGIFRTTTHSTGSLKVHLPRSFRLEMHGDAEEPETVTQLVIGDGTYIWQLFADFPDEVERYLLKSFAGDGQNFDMASIFLGAEVKSAEEVRQEFTLRGFRVTGAPHIIQIVMVPKKGKLAQNTQSITMRFSQGAIIPEYVRTESAPQAGRKPLIQERVITNIETNLTGLKPFSLQTFAFPLTNDMTVIEKANDGSDKEIPYADAMKDIQRVMQDAQQATAGTHREQTPSRGTDKSSTRK